MAPRLEIASRYGIALLATFATAKLVALLAVGAPAQAEWFGLGATDAAVALGFAGLAAVAPVRRLVVAAYAFAVAATALAAGVVQAIGSPISWPMLAGIDPAMQDSAGSFFAVRDLAGAIAVAVVGLAAPFGLRRASTRVCRVGLVACAVLAVPLGFVDRPTLPAHRNALAFLVQSAGPTPGSGARNAVTRPSRATPSDPQLAALHGVARGSDVVVVVLESAAARFLLPYGAGEDPMPFVTTLAHDGLLCTDAYAVYPESIKGQIALFHAVHPAPATEAADYARVPVPGLAALLATQGYRTGLFHAGRFRFLGMADVLARSGFEHRADAATIGGDHESSFGVDEESTVDALLAWLDAQGDAPTCTAYLPVAGHHPYDSPGGPFDADTQLGCYRNALHYADSAVRRLWDGLIARGRAERTLFVVVGDHGQAFGEHDGNFGHTFALFDENLRVPLLFRHAGVPNVRGRIDRVVSHVDIAPTILDLLGVAPCAGHEGTSLLEPVARPALFFADWGARLVGVRDGDWKCITDLDTGAAMLFDVGDDPGERVDHAAREPERAATLRALAEQFFVPRTAVVRAW